jgi:hypothetical protein
VPQPLPRAYRRQLQVEDQAKLERILAEVVDEEPASAAGATAPGDSRRLRGIPAVLRGTSGAIPGTGPLGALVAKEDRRSTTQPPASSSTYATKAVDPVTLG